MPRISRYGQVYIFAIENGGDQAFTGYTKIASTKKANTVRKIAAQRGDKKHENLIKELNGIRSVTTKIPLGRNIWVPDKERSTANFGVLAGDTGPVITDGYARVTTVDRTERTSMSVFSGYNPIVMSVPIRFESEDATGSFLGSDGAAIERDIGILEQMAGRGAFTGAGVGAPPRISVSTSDASGNTTWLIPSNYQYGTDAQGHPLNPSAPIWWVSGIDWDQDALRNSRGERIRALATVELTQYVRPDVLGNNDSASDRAKQNNKPQTILITTGVTTP